MKHLTAVAGALLMLTGCSAQTVAPVKPSDRQIVAVAFAKCGLVDDEDFESPKTIEQVEATHRCALIEIAPAADSPRFSSITTALAGRERRWKRVITGNMTPAQARADEAAEGEAMKKKIASPQQEHNRQQQQQRQQEETTVYQQQLATRAQSYCRLGG